MAVIKVYHEVTIDDKRLTATRRVTPVTLSDITQLRYCVENVSVASGNTSQVLWTSGNGGVTTFTRGLLITDQDLYIERRNDDSGTPEYVLELIEANTPYWFGAQTGGGTSERLDGAALVDNTDYADVDRIEVQNPGSTAATVSLYLF